MLNSNQPVRFGRVLQAVVVVFVVDDVKVRRQALPVHVLVQRQAQVGPRVGVGGAREAMALHALEAHLLDGGGDLPGARERGRKKEGKERTKPFIFILYSTVEEGRRESYCLTPLRNRIRGN